MFIHSEKLNPCKCGSKHKPILDSDDMFPCWSVYCRDCKTNTHDSEWSYNGAIVKWNAENKPQEEFYT